MTKEWTCPHCGGRETWFDRMITCRADGTEEGMKTRCVNCSRATDETMSEEEPKPVSISESPKTLGERLVIRNEIIKFFEAMVVEFSCTDNGVDPTLDDYVIKKGLRPFMEFYIKRFDV